LAATPPGATSNLIDGPDDPNPATKPELPDDTINKHLNLFLFFIKNARKKLSLKAVFQRQGFSVSPKKALNPIQMLNLNQIIKFDKVPIQNRPNSATSRKHG
jgi:hypothetical protein